MTAQIEKLTGIAAELDAVPNPERSHYLDIARGRLDATIKNLALHNGEIRDRAEARAAEIKAKQDELAKLQAKPAEPQKAAKG